MILYQVNRILFRRNLTSQHFRYKHNDTQLSTKILYPLKSRKLLKVAGEDSSIFLQGLITNDMRHFEEGAKSVYAMFLNNRGRVLYDTLIHQWKKDHSFLIECDSNVMNLLQKHLKIYKLKRQIDITDINEDFKVWALVSNTLPVTMEINKDISIFKDPRLINLGFRILSPTSADSIYMAQLLGKDTVIENNEDGYKYLRYKLGVSEGADDLPPATSFPLEANCDYLHGVSFHKGCYIGQELTARVHHTGVVRKRIMPIKFPQKVNSNLEINTVIASSDNPKSNLGKLRGYINDYGIGLIRIKEALNEKSLKINEDYAEVIKPSWWPVEAPKEKTAITKIE